MKGARRLFLLLAEFYRKKNNADQLAQFYRDNVTVLTELKCRYPEWEKYVNQHMSPDMQSKLREMGVPL